jgi:uracil phosphoribosyltransferase
MIIHDLGKQNSLLQIFVDELRDIHIQKDRMRFRRNIERIGEIIAYEYSKNANYQVKEIETPLAKTQINIFKEQPVICSILRAGIALHNGVLSYLDQADNAFISAYRKVQPNGIDFSIEVEYLSSPEINERILIIADPMLASGNSIQQVYETLTKESTPKEIHIFAVVAAPEGIELLENHLPKHTHLWIAKVDEGLDEKSYIVPGLGDAGDLAFGKKL